METDVLVVGGGVGACAAAWAALRRGHRVVMSEPTDWIGGQLTSQAVPPDEHPWIEQTGCTRSYRRLRDEIRVHYKRFYPLSAKARAVQHLNPGNGFVSAICHEPRVSLSVLESFLRPYQAGRRLTLLLEHAPESAEIDGDHVRAVTLRHRGGAPPLALGHSPDGERVTVRARYVVDATELGDLLPLAGIEHVTGAESHAETGEPHAPAVARPDNMQAISWCFVIDHDPHGDHTIERPRDYSFWRDYDPALTPPWGSNLLSFSATHPITLDPVVRTFDPVNPKPERGPMDLWTFRRIADRASFVDGAYESDIVLVNWPQIDYIPGNVIGVTPEEQVKHYEGARQLSLSMLYWMQTEAPRADGGTGWRGLRLRGDVTGTADGLAKAAYIRESRRIRGRFTVKEQHVGLDARMAETGKSADDVRAAE
ncbi:MAG: FAD-dependent oxidoreductase, partial [Proteobacteria bacterium]|nr:FAD-dependent oxidoreductase [Pseudomonadota bacterium]